MTRLVDAVAAVLIVALSLAVGDAAADAAAALVGAEVQHGSE